nr:uncharacterized protein LOC123284302 [Equus asinus]
MLIAVSLPLWTSLLQGGLRILSWLPPGQLRSSAAPKVWFLYPEWTLNDTQPCGVLHLSNSIILQENWNCSRCWGYGNEQGNILYFKELTSPVNLQTEVTFELVDLSDHQSKALILQRKKCSAEKPDENPDPDDHGGFGTRGLVMPALKRYGKRRWLSSLPKDGGCALLLRMLLPTSRTLCYSFHYQCGFQALEDQQKGSQ